MTPDSDGSSSVLVDFDIERILSDQDVKIENLEATVDGVDKSISDGKTLVSMPSKFCRALSEEIMAEVMRADIDEDEIKNSGSASGSSSKGKQTS